MAFNETKTLDRFGKRTTKLDLISYNEAMALKETPCGIWCRGCELVLETEFDFAAHFTVTDSEFKNLGECPTKLPIVWE